MVAAGVARDPVEIGSAALDVAVANLEKHSSHFGRQHLLWPIADELPEGAGLDQLEAAVEAAIASDRIVSIHQGEGGDRFTTPRITAAEDSFIAGAVAGVE